MPFGARAVFFDVDGVLVDSLPQHLRICVDKAREFGLDLRVPDVVRFRDLVRQGVKVSPMRDFFLAVGFPDDLAERATRDYERDFMVRYRPSAFPGVVTMLRRLWLTGPTLGLVTSNTRANVVPALAEAMGFFDPDCTFFFGDGPKPWSKAGRLIEGARRLGAPPEACVYVGDQPADADAAREAAFQFLPVTYGWGFVEGVGRSVSAPSVEAIPGALAELPYGRDIRSAAPPRPAGMAKAARMRRSSSM